MRRLILASLVVALVAVVAAAPASARVSCHGVNAKGVGQGAPAEADDPPNLVRTVARLTGGGLLQGTTTAAFAITGPTPTGLAFQGELTVSANRGTVTVGLVGGLDVSSGAFQASGPIIGSTGRLAGSTGTLTFAGVQDLADPAGAFTESVTGQICVDLGGNGTAEASGF